MTTRPGADQDAVSWTNRQREVLDLLAKGLTNGQIAEALGISLDGAKWHVSEIIARLGVDTREEAAEYWRKQNGLVWRLRSREPALVRVSRFDFAAGTWESLGTTGMLTGHGFVSWGVFVVPALGGADGGAVDNWGRMYPNGGMVDLATGEWTPLPNLPDTGKDAIAAGAFDSVDAMYTGVNGGWLLDLDSGEWARMPRIDPPGTGAQRRVTTAGRNPVVFGGARWGQGASAAGEALADAWIWRAP